MKKSELLMPSRMKGSTALFAIALTLSFAGTAWAQEQPAGQGPQADDQQTSDEQASKDIVVTGTLIRGVAATGSNTVDVSTADMKLSGVIDSNAMLTQLIPQSEGFMDAQRLQPGRGGAGTLGLAFVGPVVRASLRNLGDSFNGSGAPTLVLLDGNRIVPAGYSQSAVDVGIIPPGILERTEIVLDGTSAVYGSDAVGGTINYIPKKHFDETRVSASYGLADNYWQASADITTGVNWDGGGIGFAYSFGKNSNLLERERDWTIPRNYLDGGRLVGTACEDYSTITISGRRFLAAPGATTFPEQTGQAGFCELGYTTTVQALERHSGFVTFWQDITDSIKLEVYGFYSRRDTDANGGPYTTTATVRPTNPYYQQIPGLNNATQSVAFQWGPIFGNAANLNKSSLEVAQVSPSLTFDFGHDWQLKLLSTYGRSKVVVDQRQLDTTLVGGLVAATTLATAINPYDIGATQNKALFSNLIWHNYEDAVTTFKQARAVADGPLFTLPGGEVRVAIGAEWMKTGFKRRNTNAQTHLVNPYGRSEQRDVAAFGELNVPVVSSNNSMPGIAALTLSASARYDDYSNTGGTFNPKFSTHYQPINWITIRGNWGKSFRAPNVVDILGTQANALQCSAATDVPGCTNAGTNIVVPPGVTPDPNRPNVIISLSGSDPNLEPEKSTNWSIGADISPPVVPGLRLSATYWHVKFTNRISFPPTNVLTLLQGAPYLVTLNPTAAQIDAYAAQAQNGPTVLAVVRNSNYNVMYLQTGTTQNLSTSLVSGVDASAYYTHPTGFGSVDASFSGAWALNQKTQLIKGAVYVDNLRVNVPTFTMSATLGANIGNFRAQGSFQHRNGFDVDPSATRDPAQTHIGSFSLWNASFRYDVDGSGPLAKDLSFTLVVNNIFNQHSPIAHTTSGVNANGTTLGRLVQFGIEKAF